MEAHGMPLHRSTIAELTDKVNDLLAPEDATGRDHEQWKEWVVTYGAIELLGELTAWEAAAIECLVKWSGTTTYSPHDCGGHEPLPGVPKEWLQQGGPYRDDDRLKVPGGKALDWRIRKLQKNLERMKKNGVKFFIKQLPKSQYAGVVAYETQARVKAVSMQMPTRPATPSQVFRPYRG
jgi:hypothetical protein